MSEKKKVITGEFRVKSSDGEESIVYQHTEYVNEPTFGSPENWSEGMNEFIFNNGSFANKLSDGGFLRVNDGEVFSVISE